MDARRFRRTRRYAQCVFGSGGFSCGLSEGQIVLEIGLVRLALHLLPRRRTRRYAQRVFGSGGFGLNSGIHDAFSLGEKLSHVLSGQAPETLMDRYHRQRHTVNVEYVQNLSVKNKQNLEEKDPAKRQQRFQELRRTCADPTQARTYLLNSSMINSIARANAIA